MKNPMSNLSFLQDYSREYTLRWELYFSCTGGFIGLHDSKVDFNVYSTPVMYNLEEVIKIAEHAHKKIESEYPFFHHFLKHIRNNAFCNKGIGEFSKLKNACDNLEEWLNE